MNKAMLTIGLVSAMLVTGTVQAKKPGQAAATAPAAAERAELIRSGATRAPNAWSAYIVRLNDAPVARYRGDIKGIAPTSPIVTGSAKVDTRSRATRAYVDYLAQQQTLFMAEAEKLLRRDIHVISSYRYAINGLGLWLRNSEAQSLASLASVVSVEQEKLRQVNTDAGPDWIGANAIWGGTATTDGVGTKGEGIIIGVIDTGVNHDHPSFADIGPVDNFDHSNPHPSDGYLGVCDPATGAPYCNDKLIGVYDCNVGSPIRASDRVNARAPMVFPLNGGTYTDETCSTLDGPHFMPAGAIALHLAATDPVTSNDITVHIWYDDPVSGEPVEVTSGDFLTSPETATYAPTAGVPEGNYFAQVCPFEDALIINGSYTGAFTWDDTFSGNTPACSGAVVEDANQHGSHTASTAGGNAVVADIVAPTITIQRTLTGVAPHANLITYAGCLPEGGCLGLSLINAIEQIVIDGVDVVNYSIGGGPSNPWLDSDAQGYLSAREAGIWVATSASNNGPGAGSIGSPADAPWITTVGASTHNRVLANTVEGLEGGATAPPAAEIRGKGLTDMYPADPGTTAPIVYAGDFTSAATATPELCAFGDAAAAANPWPAGTFAGQIVVCDRGTFARVDKCKHVCEAGAGGCILANNAASGNSLVADGHSCPSVHISFDDGVALKAWLADGAPQGSHMGRISGAFPSLDPLDGDIQAGFSSRGPNRSAQDNLKPDVTNPGVDILAAVNTVGNTGPAPEFGSLSGTSMSSPHTAGSLALLRAKRSEFTPSEAQSALMMTSTRDFTRDSNGVDFGDPFDRGAGRVDLTRAALAGLVMDVPDNNYGNSATGARDLNIPSFADVNCASTCSWTRTVKSAADTTVTWTAGFSSEDAVAIDVQPGQFTLAPGATQEIIVTADLTFARHATPQGVPGAETENETQDLDADGNIIFNACTGAAGDSKDCWVFADVELRSSDSSVPDVSMPLAARSTGDIDEDGVKDLVDNCPLTPNPSQSPSDPDADEDGIADACDNCKLAANPSQCDTNGDGYGNLCDADLNNDGIVNTFDLTELRINFTATGVNDADLDCNNVVNTFDLTRMRQLFFQPPGPSDLVDN